MTQNDSSSSDTSQPDAQLDVPPSGGRAFELDLLARGGLPPLPTAFFSGRDRDLLDPVRFLDAGGMPSGPAPDVDRSELAAALGVANAAYGHPAAEELAKKLANPATRVVVTGQQPGLYGGPLYALSKMVAAVKWAQTIEAAGEPAVAVFWVATEDHDWAEVAQAAFLTRAGVKRVALGDDPSPLLPVGMRVFGPGLTEAEDELEGVDLPRRWYRPNSRFGEAFSRFMVSILGAQAPLMLDSMLPEVKRLQRPILTRLVERRDDLEAAQAAADAEIERRGHPLQVKPQPGLSPLFMLHGQTRRRIAWTEGGFALRGLDEDPRPMAQLMEILADNPSVISPGVLARPAVQDALLGTTLQIMGPAELSYMSQVAPAYSILEIDPPWTSLRPQALVIEERQASYMSELDISLAELLDTELDQLVAEKVGEDLLGPARQQIEELLAGLHGPLTAVDKSLEGPLRKTSQHIGRGLAQLDKKVSGAIARRHDVWRRRLDQVRTTVLPGGKAQERFLSVAHFTDRYGSVLGEAFLEQLGLDPRRLHVIRLTPGPSGGGPTGAGS